MRKGFCCIDCGYITTDLDLFREHLKVKHKIKLLEVEYD